MWIYQQPLIYLNPPPPKPLIEYLEGKKKKKESTHRINKEHFLWFRHWGCCRTHAGQRSLLPWG